MIPLSAEASIAEVRMLMLLLLLLCSIGYKKTEERAKV
jgi:hypothetical protein